MLYLIFILVFNFLNFLQKFNILFLDFFINFEFNEKLHILNTNNLVLLLLTLMQTFKIFIINKNSLKNICFSFSVSLVLLCKKYKNVNSSYTKELF